MLQVGHVERFNPIIRAASPYFGRPRFIDATRISPYPFRSTDVSVTLDLMIHDIDLALSITHEDPLHVFAAGAPVFSETDDIANARLEFTALRRKRRGQPRLAKEGTQVAHLPGARLSVAESA